MPVSHIDVFEPGPRDEGGRSGVEGDFVGDLKYHGGTEKAVYLFSREQLDWWQDELGQVLPSGAFGENITTRGLDVDHLVLGQRLLIGEVEVEATLPRIPCRTFAWRMDRAGWLKAFTEHGRSGAYVKVIRAGRIRVDDPIVTLPAPVHGLTVADAFRARLGDRELLARIVDARVLSPKYQADYENYLGRPAS